MTEDEAKTKWCPFVRFVALGTTSYNNRPSAKDHNATCIGSACMAWRWTSQRDHSGEKPTGYCGLAGP